MNSSFLYKNNQHYQLYQLYQLYQHRTLFGGEKCLFGCWVLVELVELVLVYTPMLITSHPRRYHHVPKMFHRGTPRN